MSKDRTLEFLARSYGIQVTYRDVGRKLQTASEETLIRMLAEFGVTLKSRADAPQALRKRRQQLAQRVVEPVVVAWEGRLTVKLQIPPEMEDQHAEFRIAPLDLLAGTSGAIRFTATLSDLPTWNERRVEGRVYRTQLWTLDEQLPLGYHELTLKLAGATYRTTVIAAPRTAWQSLPGGRQHLWGVFVPLYALHSQGSWGAGDFSDLEQLIDWVDARGGDVVATLPLLASQWDLTDDPSPYSPTSRLFWNEFYLDLSAIPELESCVAAQNLLRSKDLQATLESLRRSRFVDYSRQMALKRSVLEVLTQSVFAEHQGEPPLLSQFRKLHPEAERYARYRAVCERRQALWPEWPEPLQSGTLTPADHDEQPYRYHLFVQWQIHRQLDAVARRVRERQMVWYLDFPLGVNSHGYDVWRYPQLFAQGMAGGAPPDSFFTKGQNWGFPPLHPEQIREDGYRYFIRALRHHLKYAKLLRIDHVMGLNRLYWIPHGLHAREGAYVRYAMDELFAVLTLESHRHEAVIVGENLGTVPDAVNRAIDRHGVGEMYVVQYETQADCDPVLRPIAPGSVASLNTHDMPSFSAYWSALDVDERVDLGLMDEREADQERRQRAGLRRCIIAFLLKAGAITEATRDPLVIQEALLAHLGRSDAQVVFATLEDLWQEVDPQNSPGTFKERRNWQRKTRHTIEQFLDMPDVERLLTTLRQARRADHPESGAASARSTPVPTSGEVLP